jgi:RecB family endonuclease NucS
MECNLNPLLGIYFLASEYSTGKTHGGRIDTLGLDENDFPVIIEYKRAINEADIYNIESTQYFVDIFSPLNFHSRLFC